MTKPSFFRNVPNEAMHQFRPERYLKSLSGRPADLLWINLLIDLICCFGVYKNVEKKLSEQLLSIKPVDVLDAKSKLNKTKVTLFKGESITLTVTKKKGKVNWSSSKKSVASVSSSGKVTAKKVGTAYIYAKVGKRTLKCKVTVREPDKAKRINLAKKEAKKIVKNM